MAIYTGRYAKFLSTVYVLIYICFLLMTVPLLFLLLHLSHPFLQIEWSFHCSDSGSAQSSVWKSFIGKSQYIFLACSCPLASNRVKKKWHGWEEAWTKPALGRLPETQQDGPLMLKCGIMMNGDFTSGNGQLGAQQNPSWHILTSHCHQPSFVVLWSVGWFVTVMKPTVVSKGLYESFIYSKVCIVIRFKGYGG